MLNAHNITKEYLQDKDVAYQRVFLARSDPAMNYGLVSVVLLNKIALQRLQKLLEEIGVKTYSIVGIGSTPFRGNLKPQTVERVAEEYPSVYTFTVQSAFKYDHPPEEVRKAINKLRERKISLPQDVNEKRCIEINWKYSQEYQRQVKELATIINRAARYIPSRRKRKMHIGLFDYSRNMDGITLPRAISFTSVLYSLGLPPDILFLQKDLKLKIREFPEDFQPEEEHKELTEYIINSLRRNGAEDLGEYVLRAASLRKFLG
jgi:phosphoenolpyruvate carboxylase